jgi:hypothetical protein
VKAAAPQDEWAMSTDAPAPPPAAPGAPTIVSQDERALPREFLTDIVKKHTGSAPAPLRLMAAKGMAPIPPKDMVHVVYLLTGDPDAKVAEAAQKSFSTFPDRILQGVLGEKLAPPVLDMFAEKLADNPVWMTTILLNRNTADSTFSKVAGISTNETVITLVANNQERILRHTDICRSLKHNPHTLKSTLESVVDFMVRNGIVLDDIPEFAESISRLGKTELEAAVAHIEVPFELLSPDLQEKAFKEGKAPAGWHPGGTTAENNGEVDENISHEELERLAALEDGEGPEDEEKKRVTIQQKIFKMGTSQKIALAMKGNKECRTILIRETNKMVAEAVIKSSRITPGEIVAAANSRSINDSIIRYIANSREMTRAYGVKLALVNNPKAPVQVGARFLTLLRESDIRAVSKSKSVSAAISQQAQRIMKAKMK